MSNGENQETSRLLIWGLIVAATVAVIGCLLAPVLFDLNVPGTTGSERIAGITGLRQAALLIAGGIIAAVTLSLTDSRDRHARAKNALDAAHTEAQLADVREQREQQHQFDVERDLRSRFVSASELMSSDQAVMRTAGLYAMSALADDWNALSNKHERQVCIDIICSYVRSDWDPHGKSAPAERLARSSALRLIASHLRESEGASWAGAEFNLQSSLVSYDADMSHMHLTAGTKLNLKDSIIRSGHLDMSHMHLDGGGVVCDRSQLLAHGNVNITNSRLVSGRLSFDYATINEGRLSFMFSKFSKLRIDLSDIKFPAGEIDFQYAQLAGSTLDMDWADITGGTLDLDDVKIMNTTISFKYSTFTSGTVRTKKLGLMDTNVQENSRSTSQMIREPQGDVFAFSTLADPKD